MQHFTPPRIAQRAVTVLVHGLNNHPAVLDDLADFLSRQGSGVVTVALSGHYGDKEALRRLEKSHWLKDLEEAYQVARTHCRAGQPLYFVGYSIGALINLNLLSDTVSYDKMVLLAPAIAPKWTVYLSKPFYMLWKGMPVFSIAPSGYYAHRYLPAHVYKILFELIAMLKARKFRHCNIPALIVMDPEDETMSFSQLKKLIDMYGLSQWEVLALDSKEAIKETKFHHLIINQRAMGHKNWQFFTARLQVFFALDASRQGE